MDRPEARARHVAHRVPPAARGPRAACAVLVLLVAVSGCRAQPPSAQPGSDVEVEAADRGAFPSLGTEADGLDETVVRVTADSKTHDVRAKVADTDVDRQRGLMGVRDLPDGTGMLFLFDDDRTGGFWMRDTLVPLDIAYVGSDDTIGTILAMDPCEAPDADDCPVYTPTSAYRAALEVPQGWFSATGVEVGDAVTWDDPEVSSVRQ